MKALLLEPNLQYQIVSIAGYKDIQKYVGGYFELIPTENPEGIKYGDKNLIAYVNEEGHCLRLNYNRWGSILDEAGFYINHIIGIAGNILLVLSDEKGHNHPIEDKIIEQILKIRKEYYPSN